MFRVCSSSVSSTFFLEIPSSIYLRFFQEILPRCIPPEVHPKGLRGILARNFRDIFKSFSKCVSMDFSFLSLGILVWITTKIKLFFFHRFLQRVSCKSDPSRFLPQCDFRDSDPQALFQTTFQGSLHGVF